MIAMRRGVGLRVLRPVTFAVEPELFVAYDLTEGFQIFDRLFRAKIGQKIGVTQLIDTILRKSTGNFFESPFLFVSNASEILLVVFGCRRGTGESTRETHAALVEEHNV